jgi:deoxyribodipyrimidine photo-lyase
MIVKGVYTNHDYEPYAIDRDSKVAEYLSGAGIPFYTFKDQVIFEKSDSHEVRRVTLILFLPHIPGAGKRLFPN